MKALTSNQRHLMLAALDLALNNWESDPEAEALAEVYDWMLARPEPLVTGLFAWNTEHGYCYECGLPAAFTVSPPEAVEDHHRRCAVCAANAAVDGETISRIH